MDIDNDGQLLIFGARPVNIQELRLSCVAVGNIPGDMYSLGDTSRLRMQLSKSTDEIQSSVKKGGARTLSYTGEKSQEPLLHCRNGAVLFDMKPGTRLYIRDRNYLTRGRKANLQVGTLFFP